MKSHDIEGKQSIWRGSYVEYINCDENLEGNFSLHSYQKWRLKNYCKIVQPIGLQ